MRVVTGLTVLALTLSVSMAENRVRVTGERVNLRSGPGTGSEVISQVSAGEILGVDGIEGEWTRVVPPEGVNLWVYGELIQDGIVAVPKLMVRGGPGINYKAVGHLVEGNKVTIRGEHTGWLSIAPPPGCHLWIHSAYVENAAAPAVAAPAAGTSRPDDNTKPVRLVVPSTGGEEGKSVALVSPQKPAKPLSPAVGRPAAGDRRIVTVKPPVIDPRMLVPSREQGRPVDMSGLLRPAGRAVWRRPSRYRLVQRDNQGRAVTVCYVIGNEAQLDRLLGKNLDISGKEYWVQGVRHPAIAVERVVMEP